MAALDNIASELLKSANEADLNYKKTRDQAQRDKAVRLRRIVENLRQLVFGASDLNGLSDVTLSAPANGQVLTYNSTTTQWENQTPGGGGGGGDMYKSTYDVDNDGIVDGSETTQIIVRNSTGSTLLKGQVVYLSGATGNRPNALLSQADTEATSSKTIGIVIANIANNSDGYVAVNGTLHDLDTSAFADGVAVWLSATVAGGLTATVPAEPNHSVFIGYIARSHPTQGRLVILIQNGYELNELHGVLISSEANNDLLVYESSSTLWKNKSISTIFGGTPLVSIPTLAQVTTAGNTTTNAITVGGLTVNTNLIYTDTVNGRVGIGTTSPTEKLEVNGNIKAQYVNASIVYGSGDLDLGAAGGTTGILIKSSTRNVLINTTTDAGYKLDVNGTARVSDTATIAKALNITGTVAVTGTGNTYANTFSSNINGTFSGATIATLSVNEAGFSGTGSGIQNYAIVAGSSVFSKLTVNSQSTFTDSTAAQMRLQGYNVLTGASGNGSGTLLLTQTTSGGFLGLAATYGGGGSRISIFNQYNDGVTNSTSQVKVNIAGTDIAIFAGSGELAIGKGAALSGASLTTSTSITAASLIARGVYFNNTLVAAANNDVLVGLDINPTFTNGAFTGVSNLALRVQGNTEISRSGADTQLTIARGGGASLTLQAKANSTSFSEGVNLYWTANTWLKFVLGSSVVANFSNVGNLLVGTSTDAGYKLDVVGADSRFNGVRVGLGGGGVSTNTVVGTNALANNTTGLSNTAVGNGSLRYNIDGTYNTAYGVDSLNANTTGGQNVAMGWRALAASTTAYSNVAIGTQALFTNITGQNNTALGSNALYSNTASNNTAVGFQALNSNTSSTGLTAIGYQALKVSTGNQNTAVGFWALLANTTGANNTADGVGALQSNTTGSSNSAGGLWSLLSNVTGSFNTAYGAGALQNNTASNNTALGYQAGSFGVANTTGTNNIFIGYQSTGVSATESNRTWIGNSSTTSTWLAGNVLIGTTTDAGAKVQIKGSGNTSATTSLLVQNSSGTNALKIADDALSFYYGTFGVAQQHFYSHNGSGARRWSDSYSIIDYTRSYGDSYLIYGSSTADYIFEVKDGFWTRIRYSLNVSSTLATPNASAILQADSTTKGFLQPRMLNWQVLAITTPATGLQAYDTTNNKNLLYNGTAWQNIATESWVTGQGYLTSQPWIVSGSNIYYNTGNVGIGTTTPTDIFHIVNNTNGNKFARISAGGSDASAAWVAQNDQVDNVVYRVFGSGVSGSQMGIALARSASLMANLGGSGKFLVGTYSSTDFVMGTGNQERMRLVDSTGNFLIGTTTDLGNKLEVSGTINATAYKINNVIGYTGILNIPTNPPGMQNVDIQSGIVVNIF